MGGADRFGMLAVEDLGDRPQDLVGHGTIGGSRRESDHNGSGEGRNQWDPKATATGTTSSRVPPDTPHQIGRSRDGRIRLDFPPQRQQRLDEQAVSRHIERHIKSVGCRRNTPDRIQQQIVLPHRDQGLDVQLVLAQTLGRTIRIRRRGPPALFVPVDRFRHQTTPSKQAWAWSTTSDPPEAAANRNSPPRRTRSMTRPPRTGVPTDPPSANSVDYRRYCSHPALATDLRHQLSPEAVDVKGLDGRCRRSWRDGCLRRGGRGGPMLGGIAAAVFGPSSPQSVPNVMQAGDRRSGQQRCGGRGLAPRFGAADHPLAPIIGHAVSLRGFI